MTTMTAGTATCLAEVTLDLDEVMNPRSGKRMPADIEAWLKRACLPEAFRSRALAPVLQQAAAQLWMLVEHQLSHGIQLRLFDGHRELHFFGAVRYRVGATGRHVTGSLLDLDGRETSGIVAVERPLFSPAWVDNLVSSELSTWRAALSRAIDALPTELTRNVDAAMLRRTGEEWAKSVVRKLGSRRLDIPALRELIRNSLIVDQKAIDMARRLGLGRRQVGGVSSANVREVSDYLPQLMEVASQAPALLDLFWLTRRRWENTTGRATPLKDLKADFRKREATSEDWRRLCRVPARGVWAQWRAGRIKSLKELKDFLAEWARLHRGLSEAVSIPTPMWDLITRTYVDANSQVVHPPIRWPCHHRVLLEGIAAFRTATLLGRSKEFLWGDWARVVRWAANYDELRAISVKRTWSGALSSAALDERRLRALALSRSLKWSSPIEAFEVDGVNVSPLLTPLDLAEEAIAMRNCVDTYAKACAEGKQLLFSLRDAVTAQRRATVSITWVGGVPSLGEMRCVANTETTALDSAIARIILRRMGEAVKKKMRAPRKRPAASGAPRIAKTDSKVSVSLETFDLSFLGRAKAKDQDGSPESTLCEIRSRIPRNVTYLGSVELEVSNWTTWTIEDHFYVVRSKDKVFDWVLFSLTWDDNWGRWQWRADGRVKGVKSLQEAAQLGFAAVFKDWSIDLDERDSHPCKRFLQQLGGKKELP